MHWWNGKLEELRRETRKRFRRARNGKTKVLWTSFVTMRNNYRDAIRKAKLESWTNFCSEIEKGAEAARLDKLLSRNPEAILGALKTA